MADRTRGALPGANLEGLVGVLLDRLDDLDARVRTLEANTGRALPGDWRFIHRDGAVLLRRVSTGEECRICGGGFGSCPVAFAGRVFFDATGSATGSSGAAVGLWATMSGLDALSSVATLTMSGVGCTRPASPPTAASAGWVAQGIYPIPAAELDGPIFAFSPVPAPGGCLLSLFRFRGYLGEVHDLVVFLDTETAGVGSSAFSIDGGPWLTVGEVTWDYTCVEPE